MKRAAKFLLGLLLLVLLTGAGLYYYYFYWPKPDIPELSAEIREGSITHGGIERSFLYYLPGTPSASPTALLLVLHGGTMDAPLMRQATAYEFELLADQHGFLVVYPNGIEHHWNDCRRTDNPKQVVATIDDTGFLSALIDRFVKEQDIDPGKVFVTGMSNGGHMSYRLACEIPGKIAAIAAIVAGFPAPQVNECDCPISVATPSVMILNGTEDPLVPYEGGRGKLLGRERPPVLSAMETAKVFLPDSLQQTPGQTHRFPDADGQPDTYVERQSWQVEGGREVSLYTVQGGGHSIPDPGARAPRILGPTNQDLDAWVEIWRFFERQMKTKMGR